MPSTWLINDVSPASLGLEVVGGVFRSGSASSVRLRRVSAFDASEILSGYAGAVTIKRNGTVFFQGRIRSIPKTGDGSSEGQEYLVEDAWADMERTVYQEPWAINGGTVLMPRCYLGINSAGTEISVGEQISEALAFAASAGIDIQAGSFPTGMTLWPSEVDCISIAEVIRNSLRYYPDWIPWIDHTTTPPTFNVTPRSAAAAMGIAVTDCESLDVTELQDRLPDVVRVVFVTANDVDGTITRDYAVDKYPLTIGGVDSPDSGPGVLCTTVDLQGVNATIQKQQVQTRTIPTTGDSDDDKKNWLRLNFPILADIDNAAFDVSAWNANVAGETETPPDPINAAIERIGGPAVSITLSDVPRQLVKGNIAEWMRKKIAPVHVSWFIGETGTATPEEVEKIKKVGEEITVTATDAITRIYQSLASWTPADSAPTGIAQEYYNTIRNGARYEGSVTLSIEGINPHGKKLNLTGGVTAWATMASPIHSVIWDAQTEIAAISFGPTPEYGFSDFLEYLNLLRRRPVNWISGTERASAELGDETGPSSNGDAIGCFDTAREVFYNKVATQTHPWKVTDGGDGNAAVAAGDIFGYFLTYSAASPDSEAASDGAYQPDSIVKGPAASYAGGTVAITGTQYIYAEIPRNGVAQTTNEYAESTDSSDVNVTVELYDDIDPSDWSAGAPSDSVTLVASNDAPSAYAPTAGKAAVCIAKVTNTSGTVTVDKQYVKENQDLFIPVVNVLAVAEPPPL